MIFIGRYNKHPYRLHVLRELARLGVKYQLGARSRFETSKTYSQTRVNLNINLNGDFNQRFFEVAAAGGLLLADRLKPESGLELLFQDRRDFRAFDSPEDLAELIGYYLCHPEEALAMATAGHAQYMKSSRPEPEIQSLMNLLEDPG